MTFTDSLNNVKQIQDKESKNTNIRKEGRTILMHHNIKAEHVVVFFHGYTNCPKQFEKIGKQFFDLGYNVYIPRLKYHGHNSRISKAMQFLTHSNLINHVNISIKVAQGLGDNITVIGLSGGGTLALYSGFFYKLKKVIALAPIIDPMQYPKGFRKLAILLINLLPNKFIWWEEDVKEKINSPEHAYAWFSTKAIGSFLQLASDLEDFLKKQKPLTKNYVFFLNEVDKAANLIRLNKFISKLSNKVINTKVIEFAAKDRIHHDMIDPNQVGAKIEFVYSKIIEQLN